MEQSVESYFIEKIKAIVSIAHTLLFPYSIFLKIYFLENLNLAMGI